MPNAYLHRTSLRFVNAVPTQFPYTVPNAVLRTDRLATPSTSTAQKSGFAAYGYRRGDIPSVGLPRVAARRHVVLLHSVWCLQLLRFFRAFAARRKAEKIKKEESSRLHSAHCASHVRPHVTRQCLRFLHAHFTARSEYNVSHTESHS